MKRWLPLLLLLVGCTPEVTPKPLPTPQPTPEIVVIGIEQELEPIIQAAEICGGLDPQLILIPEIIASSETGIDRPLNIQFGRPTMEPAHTFGIGVERITFIVHAENPIKDLPPEKARAFLTGLQNNWELTGLSVTLFFPLKNTAADQWVGQILGGETLKADAILAPSPAAMLESVRSEPGALGVVPAAWLDESVQPVGPSMEIPIVVSAQKEPTGRLKNLISCLQTGEGHAAIREIYSPASEP